MNYGTVLVTNPIANAENRETPSFLVNQSIEESSDEHETNVAEDQNESEEGEEGDEEEAANTNVGQAQARQASLGVLTRRLRCLFSAVTWPLVPLGTLVVMFLLWLLYAAFIEDFYNTCSHPLHVYAYASGILLLYAPFHARTRSRIFSYNRDRDGPIRPERVRRYDQIFHTLCLFYVYGGISLLATCRDDLVDVNKTDDQIMSDDSIFLSTCEVTCPDLYQAFAFYVTSLEVFTFALLVPLFFLPCLYLWFLRRATAEAEAFAQLQETLQAEDEILIGNEGYTAEEIMDSLDRVRLIQQHSSENEEPTYKVVKLPKPCDSTTESTDTNIEASQQDENSALLGTREIVDGKECCICMTDFEVEEESPDMEYGLSRENSTGRNNANTQNRSIEADVDDDVIVRTNCGHLFHEKCLAGWLGGRWDRSRTNEADPVRRRARQTCCPLCREDLRPQTEQSTSFSQFF